MNEITPVPVIQINQYDVVASLPDENLTVGQISHRDLILITDIMNRMFDEEFWDLFSSVLEKATKEHFKIK